MKERKSGRLLFSIGLPALALLGVSTLAVSTAAATTVVAQHSQQCLDVVSGSIANGARIEQRTCSGQTRQNWTLQDAGSGTFRIIDANSTKCIQNIGGGLVNGTGLEQSTCSSSTGQLWTRQPTTTFDVYAFKHQNSGLCIDVPQASQAVGAQPTLFTCAGTPQEKAHQSFGISRIEYPSPALPVVAVHSGRCLDITGGPQATGEHALIEQWQCTGATSPTTNQIWNFQDAGNGTVRLIAQNTFGTASPKCVQPQGGVLTNATPLETLVCDANSAVQKWVRENHDGNQYSFRLDGTTSCIDIQQSGQVNGSSALLYACKGTSNQSWVVGTLPLPPNPTVDVLSGEYWKLPTNYPQKSPFGGLNHIWGLPQMNPYSPITDLHWVGGFWKKLNPADDVYDWSQLEVNGQASGSYNLNNLGDNGKSALIWTILGNKDGTQAGGFHTPQWLIDKCAAQGHPITQINVAPDLQDTYANAWGLALWEPCPRAEVLQFITGMFSKYKNDARVKYAYAVTFNAGEFWIPPNAYRDAADKGLTPAILQSFANDIIDAWVTAVGVKKVVWTSATGWSLPDGGGDVETEAVTERALNTLGTQLREGNSENVLADLVQPRIGQNTFDVVPRPGYAATNESHWYFTQAPTIQELGASGMSFYGTEFEVGDKAGVSTTTRTTARPS